MNSERNIIMKLHEASYAKYKIGDIIEYGTGVGSDKLHGIIIGYGAKEMYNKDRSDANEWYRVYTRVSALPGSEKDVHPSRIVKKLHEVKIECIVDTGSDSSREDFRIDCYVLKGGRVEEERLSGNQYILKKVKQRFSRAKVYNIHYTKY